MSPLHLHKTFGKVTRAKREQLNKHRSFIIWFTGLSGSGKSTLAYALEERLYQQKFRTYVLDGDNVRHGISCNLGFENDDRTENIRRVAEISKLFLESGVIVLVSVISPIDSDRRMARSLIPHGDFIEIYCSANLEVCENRDIKGLYAKAREGHISNFTGISSPYEEPKNPDIEIDTSIVSVVESMEIILAYLNAKKYIE